MSEAAKEKMNPAPVHELVQGCCETCEGTGKVYQEHQAGCWVGGHHKCPDCEGDCETERTCSHGCAGCDDCTDFDDGEAIAKAEGGAA